jgi:hypothetical protein
MNKVTTGDCQWWLTGATNKWWGDKKFENDIKETIRALIEHGPKVSMRFVKEFADYILAHFSYWIPKESHDYQTKKKDVEHEILTAFRNAGVKAKEADDE